MKRYIIYMVMVVAALFASCSTDNTDTPSMTEVGDIEVKFLVKGREESRLDLAPISHTITVDVQLNNENIYWSPVSDQEWCKIQQETHRGSGSFTMVIDANNEFDARETATITFVAGQYSIAKLTVSHKGNIFILNQAYAAATKHIGQKSIEIKTVEGVEWDFECDSWLSASKGESTTADGTTTTVLNISWDANEDDSRYGAVSLIDSESGDVAGWFNVWQYGTELEYDEEGYLFMAAEDAEPLELRVPKQAVRELVLPTWVTYNTIENSDDTISYMLTFANNPSDAELVRPTNISLVMLAGGEPIALLTIKQDFSAAEGIISGAGLRLFAEKWNNNESIAQWCINDIPTLLGDIDMTGIENWVSIGTEARPWIGKFNGNGKKIMNLNATQPLFGFCQDAYISELTIDENTKIELIKDYEAPLYLAALAGNIENSTIENCTSKATVKVDAATRTNASKCYVAGLVAKVDKASKIINCKSSGNTTVTSSCTTVASENSFYVGGIAAHNAGTIVDSFNDSAVSCSAMVRNSYVAGIAGYTSTSSILRGNYNSGSISFGAARGNSQSLYGHIGGIAGRGNGEISSCSNDGNITSSSTVQNQYIGGIAGTLADPNMKFTNNSQGHTAEIATSGKVTINYIGGLAGYVESAVPIEINCNTDSTTSGGTIAGSNLEYVANATASVGGYFGFCEGDVTLTAPKWTGTVYYTMLNEPHTIKEINCAGLIGHIKGKLTITSAEIGTGSSVWTKYESTTSGAANNTIKRCINMGGMVAKCEGEVSISNSINNATIEMGKGTASYAGATPNRQNDFPCYVGGFVGHITNAEATIENCENKARIYNHAYNNSAYSTSLKMNCTGGIIGAFGTTAGSNKTLTLKNCSNTAPIDSIRAFVAGIAGYVANATIDNCNYLNGRITDDQNCYMAGIVAGAMNSTITNCTATTNLAGFNGGSCSVRAGGIVAWSMGTTTIENCKYFGNINLSTYKSAVFVDGQQWGGLVGYADSEDTKVQNCQYGGQVLGVDISSNNCEKFAVAVNNDQTTNSNAQISNITYWNGK